MYPLEYLEIEFMWEKLQDFPRSSIYPADYLLLLAALDSGWKVIEPVTELFSFGTGKSHVFQFQLRHTHHRQHRYLRIKDNDLVSSFISDEKWKVITSDAVGYVHWPAQNL
jgi:hypothetical protein